MYNNDTWILYQLVIQSVIYMYSVYTAVDTREHFKVICSTRHIHCVTLGQTKMQDTDRSIDSVS